MQSELAWAAGLFEGEGTFCTSVQGGRNYAVADLCMTDEDIVRRFHEVIGVGSVHGPNGPYGVAKKVRYGWRARKYAEVVAVAEKLLPWLSDRRLVQVANALAADTRRGRP